MLQLIPCHLDLPYHQTRDQAHDYLEALAEENNLQLARAEESGLTVTNTLTARSYRLSYDSETGRLTDIELFPEHAMELVTGEIRAALPSLYATESFGQDAVASVKFFTSDSSWAWYPTEFDGADMMFGLVSGFEVELGYFSLTELESIRGALGLPLERDLYYQPQSIMELMQYHNSRR